jgi:UDP-3-O-[3-hydroxymyristoyl] glucosamine N-acyltransferase
LIRRNGFDYNGRAARVRRARASTPSGEANMKLSAIAEFLGGTVHGDAEAEISGVRDLAGAKPGDLSFVQSRKHLPAAEGSQASAFLVPSGLLVPGRPCVEVANPKAAFVMALSRFLPVAPAPVGIHPRAIVAEGARVAEGAFVGPGAVIEEGAEIAAGARVGALAVVGAGCRVGAGAVVHPGVALYPGTVLGDRSILHSGTVIGADGFGYVQAGKKADAEGGAAIERYVQVEGPHLKVPQLGRVVIGEDVEIGACVTVDRATLGETVIGKGTKIDNQVQVGHNVRIGEHVIIVAEVGIGGSAAIGNHVTIGGNCGISEGAEIGDFCIVGAHSLVYPGKKFPPRTVIFGNPAREAKKTQEQIAALTGLPRLAKKVGDLEERLAALERKSAPRPARPPEGGAQAARPPQHDK